MPKIDVSIVIISWNMKDLLQTCLKSIYNYTKDIFFEVIVIDNNSIDGTFESIREMFPDVQIIKNQENRGVAPARGQGMQLARGEYILIFNSDTELIENSIKSLYEFMKNNKDCGIVGSKLVNSQMDMQFSCKRFPSLLALLFRRMEYLKFIKESKILKDIL